MPPQGTRKYLDGFAYNIDLILYNIKAQDLYVNNPVLKVQAKQKQHTIHPRFTNAA